MNGENIAIRAILCYLSKKGPWEKVAVKESNEVEGPGTVIERVV